MVVALFGEISAEVQPAGGDFPGVGGHVGSGGQASSHAKLGSGHCSALMLCCVYAVHELNDIIQVSLVKRRKAD